MNILILNGSPKGKNSITIKTSEYLSLRFPQHKFEFFNVASQIKALERDFSNAKEALDRADLIIFSYPVYTFIAPYQLHRFIELLKSHDVDLSNKYASQISTSKHFYDVTAHKFIEENCLDLNLRYIDGLSADMDDLRCEKGRFEADCFFERLMFNIKNEIFKKRLDNSNLTQPKEYLANLPCIEKSEGKDVVIVSSYDKSDVNLINMIADFKNSCKYNVREINIREYPFKGGCLGCMSCSVSAKCVYNDKFEDFIKEQIHCADAIVYAFSIKNHFAHSSMKCYDDRQFCNGHRTLSEGKSTGYIISGNFSTESNLQTIVEARANVGSMYFCGVASDEFDTKKSITNLTQSLSFALETKAKEPQTFYGVGGSKIFRDLVFLMQGLMKADHKFYKKNGKYDFPQNNKKMLWGMKFLGLAMKSPKVQKKMQSQMTKYITMPYDKILQETKPKE